MTVIIKLLAGAAILITLTVGIILWILLAPFIAIAGLIFSK